MLDKGIRCQFGELRLNGLYEGGTVNNYVCRTQNMQGWGEKGLSWGWFRLIHKLSWYLRRLSVAVWKLTRGTLIAGSTQMKYTGRPAFAFMCVTVTHGIRKYHTTQHTEEHWLHCYRLQNRGLCCWYARYLCLLCLLLLMRLAAPVKQRQNCATWRRWKF